MKRLLLLLTIPILLATAAETKIGFVDSERIFSEYQATAAAKVEFNEYLATYRDSAGILKQHIENLKSELEQQKLVLSEEARLRKLDEIESLTQAYNQFLQDVFGENGRVERKNRELMAPLITKVNDAVAKIAEQENFTVVLDLAEGVFYASSEMDITTLVIDELNLEYGPQIITGDIKKYIAVMPLREENSEAQNADLGQTCQGHLYNALSAFGQQYYIVSQLQINSKIRDRGYYTNLDETQAYNVAFDLDCDYYITGMVKKFGMKIEYTITLRDAEKKIVIFSINNSVSEDIKLPESLNNDLRALIEKIQK